MGHYLWVVRFPIIFAYTLYTKIKNGRLVGCNKDYKGHQEEFYSHPLTTDKSDKFHKERQRISKLAKSEGRNKSVLEIGTGAGWQALNLEQAGFEQITAIDLVEKRIEFCKTTHPTTKAEFKVMDATNLEYENASFDAVVFSAMLHDIAREPRIKALEEAMRVAGNTIIVFEPRYFSNRLHALAYGIVGEIVDESSSFLDFVNHDLDKVFSENGWMLTSSELAWHKMLCISVYERI